MFATDSFDPSSSSSPSATTSSATGAEDTPKADAGRDEQVRDDEVKSDEVQRGERAMTMKATPREESTPAMDARQRDEFVPARTGSRAMPALTDPAPRSTERAMTMGQSRRTEDTAKADAPVRSAPPAKPDPAPRSTERAMTMGAPRRTEDTTKADAPAQSAPPAKAEAPAKPDPAPRGERAMTMGASRRSDDPVRANAPAPVPLRSMQGYRQPTSTTPSPASRERAMTMSAPRRPEDATKADAPAKPQEPSAPPRQGGYRPGALWVDPKYNAGQIRNGVIDNAKFPDNKSPVTKPPDPMTAAVGIRPMTYTDANGATHTMSTPEEYKKQVAANRRAAGMPEMGGEPVEVHLAVQGGGGAGRRFPAALNEMASLGIAPGSFSGASAGGITASLMAAGATPAQLEEIVKDPALGGMQDWQNPATSHGGAWAGEKAYEYFDRKLQDLTGIHDRPVTFRDLPFPLQIVAMKATDSAQPNLSNPLDRIFTFSQETTPDTPVALAVRSSMSIPGGFDPVHAVDPQTGRKIQFMDGGVVDNLPIGYNRNNLPTLGLAPIYEKDTHPADHDKVPIRDSAWGYGHGWIANGWTGYSLKGSGATDTRDFRDRSFPGPNQFQLGVPVFSEKDPGVYDDWKKFGWESFDPKLDGETRNVTRDFMRSTLPDIGTPGARATNTNPTVPRDISFNRPFTFDGRAFDAMHSSSYLDGGRVTLRPRDGGHSIQLNLGRRELERMWLDDRNFGGNRIGSYMMNELRKQKEFAEGMEGALRAVN
ncbi:MAG TPA: patatin-like phospholipase family protein [Myxococcaceae bacterium]|nr:patatin-like phospholipase family protein [Myxococcaceae bacterium]